MKTKWTIEQINEWFNNQPWIRGHNFLPSNVVNRLDMFQSYNHEEHLTLADKELQISEDLGFNSVRLWANFDCYLEEKEKFLDIF